MKQEQQLRSHYDLIVFCHLRWEFVYQRPQHIISRMAQHGKVLFIEEPLPFAPEEENTAHIYQVGDAITVLQPRVRDIEDIGKVFKEMDQISARVGWMYSPAFIPLLKTFALDKVVYDCMDELTLFRGADPKLVEQEQKLLSVADMVFTGGKRLYESKKKVHGNVHCFPSSVDHSHFRKALNGIAVPKDMNFIHQPVVGYYGVIDERIDMDLLGETAKLLPDACFVMIGPLAKISHDDLAKGHNIHYLGMRSYEELPGYLKKFDIAMMPFAMNEATHFISPTKTLEYMAAYKPIISTPVYDVVRDYSHCVHIVSTSSEFRNAVNSIMADKDKGALIANFDKVLEDTSWDSTVEKMLQILD